ncbi:MAG: C40 family peptidase [Bacteroidales bacterium]|nr:C40 family peptidase [Bacteroidales bacterium]
MSLFTASAQDMMPEAMPARCTAEKIVTEVAAVTLESEAEAARTVRTTTARNRFGENIVKTALQYLGARYRSGMSGPYAFDCSGFTSYVYGCENVSITRSSRSQYTQGMPVRNVADLQKGDLVFFGGSRSHSSVGHVGIVTDVDPVTGKFSFVHASRTGVKVSESNEPYYSRRYIGARRIVE